MKHIVDNLNKMDLRIKTLDLAGRVPGPDSIELLRVELYYDGEYGPLSGARVRSPVTALNKWKASPSIYTKVPSLLLYLSKRLDWKKNSRRLDPKSPGLYTKIWRRADARLGCHHLPIKCNWKLSNA